MKAGLVFHFGRALLLACLLATTAAAQTSGELPGPVRLSLMLRMFEGAAPTFYPLADKDKAGSAAIIRDFRRLPRAWPSGGAPVDSVVLTFSREGPGARVKVYAHRASEHARQSL